MDGAKRRMENEAMNNLPRACKFTRRGALRRIPGAIFLTALVARLAAQPVEIKRQPIESSVLASVGFDAKTRLLEVQFHSGAIYLYLDVPEQIYRSLLAAESKGQFFGANIRNKFRSELMKARDAK